MLEILHLSPLCDESGVCMLVEVLSDEDCTPQQLYIAPCEGSERGVSDPSGPKLLLLRLLRPRMMAAAGSATCMGHTAGAAMQFALSDAAEQLERVAFCGGLPPKSHFHILTFGILF